jgi:hypothetical protein
MLSLLACTYMFGLVFGVHWSIHILYLFWTVHFIGNAQLGTARLPWFNRCLKCNKLWSNTY